MKRSLLLAFVCCVATMAAKAQLTGNRWAATVSIPSPTEAYLKFDKDTVTLIGTADNSPIEGMTFVQKSDTLALIKVFGGSPCADSKPVHYKFAIKEEAVTFENIDDDCDPRSSAFTAQPWKLVK